jgi:glycosyltransferase involved in cell wall biosynthesis
MNAPVAVVILTFNEEDNLAMALDSVVGWAGEVFVVDSFSTDRTIDIALGYANRGVQVVQHAFVNYSDQWNWALTRLPISRPWVLKLDADERATTAFRRDVDDAVRAPDAPSAFVIHWKHVFMGKELNWGGLYPNGNTRLWRTGSAKFGTREVNEHLVVSGPVGSIRSPITHKDYKSLGAWLDRHNRYSAMEARAIEAGNVTGTPPKLFGRPDERRMWLRKVYFRLPCRPFLYFLYRYLLRLGFLDGRVGFRFAFLHASFLYWIDLKRAEIRQTGRLPEVTWPPRGGPHPLVAASALQRQVDAV